MFRIHKSAEYSTKGEEKGHGSDLPVNFTID